MKRLDLVQLTIIIIGLISAFNCLGLIPAFLIYMFAWFATGFTGGINMEAVIENILLLGTYSIFAIYCIRNSKQLAGWISNRASLYADINIVINKTTLLYALFLGLGIYGLIKELPLLLSTGYNYIKESNHYFRDTGSNNWMQEKLIIQAIKVPLFLILVFYAKTFSEFFGAKINNIEPADEINDNTD